MMDSLASIGFAYPAALLGLLALPLIYWLLRTTPPRPREVRFPPFRLLLALRDRRRQPARTPWWLLVLRMALATALILALAGPQLLPREQGVAIGKGAWLVVLDDGWAAARNWPAMREMLMRTLVEAERHDAPVALLTTTPRRVGADGTPRPPAEWRERLRALQPAALDADHAAVARLVRRLDWQPGHVVWLSDGVRASGSRALLRALAALGAPVRVHMPREEALPLVLLPPKTERQGLRIAALRALDSGARVEPVILRARNGRPLAQADVVFHPGARRGEVLLKVPPALRNEAARVEIAGQNHAAATWLLGDAFKHRNVLVVSGETTRRHQPLLSETYYVTRALAPFADVVEERDARAIARWLKAGLSMLVLADVGRLPGPDEQMLLRWLRNGGVLLRFAGERIVNANASLLPVALRRQERALGATLSWQKPQPLGGFSDESPLAGLAVDAEVKVRKQVLAEPDAELPGHIWATLADGTPLITARRVGRGWLVLVHVTASPAWSNLPLSGLFVHMLQRMVMIAQPARPMPAIDNIPARAGNLLDMQEDVLPDSGERPAGALRPASGAFTPRRMLSGRGELGPMPPQAMPIAARDFDNVRPSLRHPAGIYSRGGQVRALNVGHEGMVHAALPALPDGFARAGYRIAGVRELAPALLLAAAGLFLLDLLAMLWLASGGAPRNLLRRAGAAAAGTSVLLVMAATLPSALSSALAQQATPPPVERSAGDGAGDKERAGPSAASSEEARRLAFAMAAARNLRLAFVRSGDARVDDLALAGLRGLSEQLFERSSVEPDEPLAIDIERDEIAFFPLLYWPIAANTRTPSPAALRKLETFLKNGGTILFDTRDAPQAIASPDGMTPERRALRRILSRLDIPPLEPVPSTHVLTRSFFLLKSFPGRYAESELWVEATSIGRERRKLSPANADGVSSILITGNDLAGAWAVSVSGQPLLPTTPGGARQREMAYRAGINIVMYALTGNYKADQVHLPTILQRLGQ